MQEVVAMCGERARVLKALRTNIFTNLKANSGPLFRLSVHQEHQQHSLATQQPCNAAGGRPGSVSDYVQNLPRCPGGDVITPGLRHASWSPGVLLWQSELLVAAFSV